MDRGAWWAAVYGVAKSWARLSDWTELKIGGGEVEIFLVGEVLSEEMDLLCSQ